MYAEKTANYVSSLQFGDLPPDVVQKAKDCVLDHMGTVLGAYSFEESRMIVDWVRALAGLPEATILGWGVRTSARDAALANGYLAEVLETQDGVTYGNNHPASVILPAAIAAAESENSNGRDFIAAVVAGYEVMNRIAAAIPGESSVGFMKTATAGIFGAAMAVGKLMKLNQAQLINALGIAGFVMPISTRENMWGATIKPMVGGGAAKAAVEAASLARHGFTGCQEIFAGTPPRYLGFCKLISSDPKLEKIVEGLGQKFTILDVYYKPYAACRLAHSAIEAALILVREHDIKPEAVEWVEVRTFERAAREIGQRYPDADSNFIMCQFSLPFMLAVVLTDRNMGPEQYSRKTITNPVIHELASRVRVVADDSMSRLYPEKAPALVRMILRNGATVEQQIDCHKWEPVRGIPEAEFYSKFNELAGKVLDEPRRSKLASLVKSLDEVDNIAALVRQTLP